MSLRAATATAARDGSASLPATSASPTPVRGTPGRHGRRPTLPPGPRRLRAVSQHWMGGKPVVETAKQNDVEMDKSEYRPPHRNCTGCRSQDPLGANALENALVQGIIAKRVLRS
jgi:hypothetical protein